MRLGKPYRLRTMALLPELTADDFQLNIESRRPTRVEPSIAAELFIFLCRLSRIIEDILLMEGPVTC